MRSRQRKAYGYALSAVLLWSTVASAFKLTLRHLDPFQLLLYSVLVSIVVLSAILLAQGKLGRIRSCSRKQLAMSALLGVLNPFLYYTILFEAYDRLPAQEAQPLNYTWAITLSLLSIPLLKQRIRAMELVAALVAYAGVVVIATHGDVASLRFSNPLGVGLALGSTVIWALFWIGNARDSRDPAVALLLNFLFALPCVFLACLFFSTPVVTAGWGLLGAAYVGAFEMGIAFVLWSTALRLSETTAKVSTLIFISPFLSLVWIYLFVGEEILGSTFVGLMLIVGGLLLQHRVKTPSRSQETPHTEDRRSR